MTLVLPLFPFGLAVLLCCLEFGLRAEPMLLSFEYVHDIPKPRRDASSRAPLCLFGPGLSGSKGIQRTDLCGGDLASTGARDCGMRAERHVLVNPVENNLTANQQLALAA